MSLVGAALRAVGELEAERKRTIGPTVKEALGAYLAAKEAETERGELSLLTMIKLRSKAGKIRYWPEPNLEAINATVSGGPGFVDLWEASPIRLKDDNQAEAIVDDIFPGNPLLCCGLSTQVSAARRRKTWRGHLHRRPRHPKNKKTCCFTRGELKEP